MSNHQFLKEVTAAIGAHGAWKMRLKTVVAVGRSEVSVADIKSDCKCAFGTWLYGPSIDAETRRGMPYQVVKRLHAEFHECAGRVVDLSVKGRKDEARGILEDEFAQRSEKLGRALNKWKGELIAEGQDALYRHG
jgi:hypothetical protein